MRQLKNINWIMWIGVAVGLLILVRVLPAFLPVILLSLSLLIVLVGIFFFSQFFKKKKRATAVNGQERIENQINDCKTHILELEEKLKEIERDIQGVKRDLNDPLVSENNKTELKDILGSFENEKELRKLKLQFYYTALEKLEKMQLNQRVKNDIQEKQQKLNQLKENHFEELAEMENVRSDIEMDVFYLDTIDELSSQVLKMEGTNSNLNLQDELKKLKQELDRLN